MTRLTRFWTSILDEKSQGCKRFQLLNTLHLLAPHLSNQQKISKPLYIQGLETLLIKATTRFELVIRVLQTHALPLGYVAIFNY